MSFRNSRRRAVCAFVLVAVLFSTLPARALPLDSRFRDDRGAVTSFLEAVQRFWRGLWESETSNALRKEGMTIDPNGQPHGGTNPGATTDEGTSIDPHG
jgi:hypothetical protein